MELKNIIPALLNASKTIKNPQRTADNPFFHSKYTPLDKLIDETKPVLASNGLVIVQGNYPASEGKIGIKTVIFHISGEYIEFMLEIPYTKNDPQQAGSAITYGRRYAYAAILNIASDSDDDANTATDSKPITYKPANSVWAKPENKAAVKPEPDGEGMVLAIIKSVEEKEASNGKKYYVINYVEEATGIIGKCSTFSCTEATGVTPLIGKVCRLSYEARKGYKNFKSIGDVK